MTEPAPSQERSQAHRPPPAAFHARCLVVDDEQSSSVILKSILTGAGHRVECAADESELMTALARYSFDMIFLDYRLGESDGLELLPFLLREHPHCRVVIITAHGSIDLAVDAMHRGASGFVTKPFDEAKVLEEITPHLHGSWPQKEGSPFAPRSGIIGRSPALRRIHEQIGKMKDVDSTVLIQGESGTGKELVARALHEQSKRCRFKFEGVNCAAIPEQLLEAELFGVKKGAFTDAKADRKGLFEVCSEGTLFLDEVGEMPLHLQGKLLRALQEKEISPLGGQGTVSVNTRVITASNRNLEELVAAGQFRRDLFYRLSVLQIDVPPLRERSEDIPELVHHFVDRICKRLGKTVQPPPQEVLSRLEVCEWPGNVRELQNCLERAIVLTDNERLDVEDLFARKEEPRPAVYREGDSTSFKDLSQAKEEFEKEYLERLLAATRGNVTEASKIAGRMRTDMYRLFSKHGIEPARYKP